MKIVDSEPTGRTEPLEPELETYHLYIWREGDPWPEPERSPYTVAVCITIACIVMLAALVIGSLLMPAPDSAIAFSVDVPAIRLAPVSQSLSVTAKATGRGTISAETATGSITFYNGLFYSQVIPAGMALTGNDGVVVVTDSAVTVSPATQTYPPTYGQASVAAHALNPGASGNIQAGDINVQCCASGIAVQNPDAFTGGRDAGHYPYVTQQDVKRAAAPVIAQLTAQTPRLFATPRIYGLQCAPQVKATPQIGAKASSSRVSVMVTCNAVTFSLQAVERAIDAYAAKRGPGALSNVVYQVVGTEGERIALYVTGNWYPIMIRRTWAGK